MSDWKTANDFSHPADWRRIAKGITMGTSGLGSLLVEEGLLTEKDRRTIKRSCGHEGAAFARSIVALGLLSEDELAAFLAERTPHRIVAKDISKEAQPDALRAIDQPLVERLAVVPLKLDGQNLTVAMADPLDYDTLRQLEFFSGYKIKPVIASFSQIRIGLSQIRRDFKPQASHLEEFLANHAIAATRRLTNLEGIPKAPQPKKRRAAKPAAAPAPARPKAAPKVAFDDFEDDGLEYPGHGTPTATNQEFSAFVAATEPSAQLNDDDSGDLEITSDQDVGFESGADLESEMTDSEPIAAAETNDESGTPLDSLNSLDGLQELDELQARTSERGESATATDSLTALTSLTDMEDESTSINTAAGDELFGDSDSFAPKTANGTADNDGAAAAEETDDLLSDLSTDFENQPVTEARDEASSLDALLTPGNAAKQNIEKTLEDMKNPLPSASSETLDDAIDLDLTTTQSLSEDLGDIDHPVFGDDLSKDIGPQPTSAVSGDDEFGFGDDLSRDVKPAIAVLSNDVDSAINDDRHDENNLFGDDLSDTADATNQIQNPTKAGIQDQDDLLVPIVTAVNKALLKLSMTKDPRTAAEQAAQAFAAAGMVQGVIYKLQSNTCQPLGQWLTTEKVTTYSQADLPVLQSPGLVTALERLKLGWQPMGENMRAVDLKPFAAWQTPNRSLMAAMVTGQNIGVIAAWDKTMAEHSDVQISTYELLKQLVKRL